MAAAGVIIRCAAARIVAAGPARVWVRSNYWALPSARDGSFPRRLGIQCLSVESVVYRKYLADMTSLRSPVSLVALLAMLLLGTAVRGSAAPLALVTDIVGDAQHAGAPLKLLAELESGREVALAAEATVVVFYVGDGSEWVLRGPGRYRLALPGPEAQPPAVAAQRRPGPPAYRDIKLRADRVQQGGLVMRSRALMLVSPVQEVVLSSDVQFVWEPLENARAYQFELVDQDGQKLFTAETPDTELALPLAIQLKPGEVYYWAVRSRRTSTSQPLYRAAEFRVADALTKRRVEAARPKPDAPFSERALFIVLLEDVGARSAALRQRQLLAPERPVGWASGN